MLEPSRGQSESTEIEVEPRTGTGDEPTHKQGATVIEGEPTTSASDELADKQSPEIKDELRTGEGDEPARGRFKNAGVEDGPGLLQIREKYRHFRILVIGRANAGKTTLLKRVCNTTDEPSIYDEQKKNLVCSNLLSAKLQTSTDCLQYKQLEPTDGVSILFVKLPGQYFDTYHPQRGIHDIHRAFGFKANPGFAFHDSPGFEAGDDRQLKEAQSFITQCAKATDVADQLHVIWRAF